MLSPGESVIPAKMTSKYGSLIQGMISDNIPGYANGKLPIYAENAIRLQNASQNMSQKAGGGTGVFDVLSMLAARVGEAKGIAVTQRNISSSKFDDIATQYKDLTQNFVNQLNKTIKQC